VLYRRLFLNKNCLPIGAGKSRRQGHGLTISRQFYGGVAG
jgi:hypothetical protein